MAPQFNRRGFLKRSAALAGALASGQLLSPISLSAQAKDADISVVNGDDPGAMVREALELLGGIERFVKRGDAVALLPNPQGGRPGVSTNAGMVAETIKLCLEAGAAQVTVASIHQPKRWFDAGIIDEVEKAGGKIHYPSTDEDWVQIPVPKGRILEEVPVIRKALENDALINMPIAKQHDSAQMTCTLKNLMGFHANNRSFHQGAAHLHQCIVDLATLFSPKLLIVDANTVLAENGPFGPGKLISPNKVIAGTDMVAVDAFCCGIFQLKPTQVAHITGAHDVGLGEIDASRLAFREARI